MRVRGSTAVRCVSASLRLGSEVHAIVTALYVEKHAKTVEQIGGVLVDDFAKMNQSLARLERFWADQIKYRL